MELKPWKKGDSEGTKPASGGFGPDTTQDERSGSSGKSVRTLPAAYSRLSLDAAGRRETRQTVTALKENKGLSACLTDYLEAIFQLERSNRVARAKDIAGRLKVGKASVTGVLKALAGRGLIYHSPYSYVTLTPSGRKTAREVVRRNEIVRDFFTNILHMDPEGAEANARRIGHAIDPPAVDKLVRFLEFVEFCPRTDMTWLDAFGRFCRHEPCASDCRTCVETCIRQPGD